MKTSLILAGFVLTLTACNNSSQQAQNSSDSGNHSSHDVGVTGTLSTIDSAAARSGNSIMAIMQSNMDQMKGMKSLGDPDHDFADLMKTHHAGAVEMAELERAQGTDTQLKEMAQKMLDAQQKEISELDAFLSNNKATNSNTAFHEEAMKQMNQMKMDMNHEGSVDHQFAQMMIPHHQGGIDMARAYLKSGAKDEKLKSMANKIIGDQQKEIQQLQAWLNKNK